MLTKEVIAPFLEGAKNLADATTGVASELIAEAINLYILMGVLAVLKFAAVFVIYFIIRKYLNNLPEEFNAAKHAGLTIALIGSLVFFTIKSFPHLQEMTKAMVAPKIFLIEKGAALIKGTEK